MKNLFLDLGTHLGQGLSHFIEILKIDKTWEVVSFEANPITYKKFDTTETKQTIINKTNAVFLNKAVYINNGLIKFNTETPPNEDETGMGSSLISLEEWQPWSGTTAQFFKNSHEVECIDFSSFVETHKDYTIFCKMDIEGAEFIVLEKMMQDGTLKNINKIWVEFHDHFFKHSNEMFKEKQKILKYAADNGVVLHEWH